MKINPKVIGVVLLVLALSVGLAAWYFSRQQKVESPGPVPGPVPVTVPLVPTVPGPVPVQGPTPATGLSYKGLWALNGCKSVFIGDSTIDIEGSVPVPYTVNSSTSISFAYDGTGTEIRFSSSTGNGSMYQGTALVGTVTKGPKVGMCTQNPAPSRLPSMAPV